MKLTYDEGTPAWLIQLGNTMTTRRPQLEQGFVHVTQLLQPAPMLSLQQQYWEQLTTPVDNMIPALLGSAWHKYVEGVMGTAGYSERTIEISHNTWTLSGTPDWFDKNRIIDFKTTRTWSSIYGKPEWEQQLNIYRWVIFQATGLVIPELEIHVVYTDWTQNGAKRNAEYPRKRWEVINVPAWGFEDVRNFVDTRLMAIEAVKLGDVCTPEQRWERGECWAVMKKGRKSAMPNGLKDNPNEAVAMAKTLSGGYVEHREGNPVRCKDWCSVREFCEFGKTLNSEGSGDE